MGRGQHNIIKNIFKTGCAQASSTIPFNVFQLFSQQSFLVHCRLCSIAYISALLYVCPSDVPIIWFDSIFFCVREALFIDTLYFHAAMYMFCSVHVMHGSHKCRYESSSRRPCADGQTSLNASRVYALSLCIMQISFALHHVELARPNKKWAHNFASNDE